MVCNFLKSKRKGEFWTTSIKHCFLDLNHELLQIIPCHGTTKMFISELKPFTDKLNNNRHLDLPVFSTIFKLKSNRNFFTGHPPRPMSPRVESQQPPWANLSVRQTLSMNKQELDLAFGYQLTPAAFFNFKNNIIPIARFISKNPTENPIKLTGKLTSKKIRLYLTPISKISCPLFDYLNSKSNLNIPLTDPKCFSKLAKLNGIDISLKNFLTLLHFNKIKSPAQRFHYETVANNGFCRECPVQLKDTTFHQLFECHDNQLLLTKLKQEYIIGDNLNFSLQSFLSNSISDNK